MEMIMSMFIDPGLLFLFTRMNPKLFLAQYQQ